MFREQTNLYSLRSQVSVGTNGVINKKNLEWVIQSFDRVNISFDGPEDIQNKQRPLRGGQGSFEYVFETIRYFEKNKFNYGIRATIAQNSAHRMPEIVEFLHSISSLKSFHFEPLFQCGRCVLTGADSPNPEDFLKYLIEAGKTGDKLGVSIYYSGSKLDKNHNVFCASAGNSFCVLPDGNVTACLEICRKSDSRADIFMIGKYDSKKKCFYFDKERILRLKARTVENIPTCKDCFAKYNCTGDCLARVCAQSGSLCNVKNNVRCLINQGFTKYQITKQLKGGNKK